MRTQKIVSALLFALLLAGLIGNVQSASEPSTYALTFDGNAVEIADNASLKPANAITVSLWCYPTQLPEVADEMGIINKFSAIPAGGYLVYLDGWSSPTGKFSFELISNGSVKQVWSDAVPTLNSWSYVVCIGEVGVGMKMYVNSIEQASTDILPMMNHTTSNLYFGNWTVDFQGILDEVLIYNRGINSTEISYAYNSGVGNYAPLNSTGLVAWWKFDEGTGSDLRDRSGNANHGSVLGATWTDGKVPDWYSINQLYIQPNYNATLNSVSYQEPKLTFTVSASSGTISATEVYCGSKGEPTSVSGAGSWSFNASTRICTINIVHSSSQEIIVSWEFGGWGTWWGSWWIIPSLLAALLTFLKKQEVTVNPHVLLGLIVLIEDSFLRVLPIMFLGAWMSLWSIFVLSVFADALAHVFKDVNLLPKGLALSLMYNGVWYGLFLLGGFLIHPYVGILFGILFHYLLDVFLTRKKFEELF